MYQFDVVTLFPEMFEGFLAMKLRERCGDLIAAERASTWEVGP